MSGELPGSLTDVPPPSGEPDPAADPGPSLAIPETVPPPEPRTVGSIARGLVRTGRPKQYVKNVLVFAAPAAGAGLGDADVILKALLCFVAFCLVSSATYILNDVGDVEADRAHPTKRQRPIASGVVPVPIALVAVVGLLVLGLGLAYAISWQLGLLLTAYKALTIAYTFRLKHTAILDIVVVATGFAVRAISGGVAVDIALSQWFLAVTCFGSLFMVAGKRHGELLHVGEGGATRKALTQYTVEYLRFVVTMAASVTILTYCLWAFEHPRTSDIPWWGLSIVPFVMGIMRYALLVDQGKGGAPEELVIRDPGLRVIGIAWVALFLGSVYL
ncbi:decaprenyl-phosphate phosphoribosyltransferase [Patulibacter sp.]|uniref:decaprenyl-phosphate phosphoribosyltransferase n=1 Tax=Patulibacter sp. TaxID=1912859 RepID=UPI002716F615|nr:decaprenyl-phosphate phosphoribosyltransferase [Patulibacter sp.]MDO9407574.1 decaprenyl-phosphate phosphoribosyltransferase [Patulibacter sp.]